MAYHRGKLKASQERVQRVRAIAQATERRLEGRIVCAFALTILAGLVVCLVSEWVWVLTATGAGLLALGLSVMWRKELAEARRGFQAELRKAEVEVLRHRGLVDQAEARLSSYLLEKDLCVAAVERFRFW